MNLKTKIKMKAEMPRFISVLVPHWASADPNEESVLLATKKSMSYHAAVSTSAPLKTLKSSKGILEYNIPMTVE